MAMPAPQATLGEAPAAARGLCLLGGAAVFLFALVAATPFAFRAYGDNAYMALAVASGLVAAGATVIAERTPSARALWLILGVALVLRLCLLVLDPLLSSDVYRYVWDGKVQAAGINPYRYVPADLSLAALRDVSVYPKINRADYAVTIYPPVAQMFFLLATRLAESVIAVKTALLACEGVTIALILMLLQQLGRPLTRVVGYAWHPLPIWEIANSGHIDALMVALMMLGLWLAISGKPVRGAAALALAVLAKPIAVLALPAAWRPWDWKAPLAALGIAAICYAPYLGVGTGVLGFLAKGYLQEEQFSSGDGIWPLAVMRWLFGSFPADLALYACVALVVIAAMALRLSSRKERSAETVLTDVTRLLLVGLFLMSPNYPWYFLIATPFVALVGGLPVWVLTVGATLLQQELQWEPWMPLLVRKTVIFGVFIAACAYAWRPRLAKGVVHGSATSR